MISYVQMQILHIFVDSNLIFDGFVGVWVAQISKVQVSYIKLFKICYFSEILRGGAWARGAEVPPLRISENERIFNKATTKT